MEEQIIRIMGNDETDKCGNLVSYVLSYLNYPNTQKFTCTKKGNFYVPFIIELLYSHY